MSVSVAEDRISNAKLRREFEQRRAKGWLTCDLVATRLGWFNWLGKPDGSRVLRALGVSGSQDRHGKRYTQGKISRERAAELARAMDLDPVDVDL